MQQSPAKLRSSSSAAPRWIMFVQPRQSCLQMWRKKLWKLAVNDSTVKELHILSITHLSSLQWKRMSSSESIQNPGMYANVVCHSLQICSSSEHAAQRCSVSAGMTEHLHQLPCSLNSAVATLLWQLGRRQRKGGGGSKQELQLGEMTKGKMRRGDVKLEVACKCWCYAIINITDFNLEQTCLLSVIQACLSSVYKCF